MDNRNDNPDRLIFGELLNKLRLDRNLTKFDLASTIGVNQSEVDDWEKGRSVPSQNELMKLGQKLMLGKSEMDSLYKAAQQFEISPKKPTSTPESSVEATDKKKSPEAGDAPGEQSVNAQADRPLERDQPAEMPQGPPSPKVLYKPQIYVEANSLIVLDDLREEQSQWQGYSGISWGAALTVIISLVTGGVMKTVTWVFLAACIVAGLITGSTALQKKRKARDARKKLLEESK